MLLFSHELLSGKIDGENRLFELKAIPLAGSLHLFSFPSGKILEPGTDYHVVKTNIILEVPPPVGTRLKATFLMDESSGKTT